MKCSGKTLCRVLLGLVVGAFSAGPASALEVGQRRRRISR